MRRREGRERVVKRGWGGGEGVAGDPDGATDVLAAAALLCRQTGSSELGLFALLPALPCYPLLSPHRFSFPSLRSVLLF